MEHSGRLSLRAVPINYVEVQDRRRLSGFHLVFQRWPHMAEGSRVFTEPRRFPFASVGVFVERTSQTTVAQKFMISLCIGARRQSVVKFFKRGDWREKWASLINGTVYSTLSLPSDERVIIMDRELQPPRFHCPGILPPPDTLWRKS